MIKSSMKWNYEFKQCFFTDAIQQTIRMRFPWDFMCEQFY